MWAPAGKSSEKSTITVITKHSASASVSLFLEEGIAQQDMFPKTWLNGLTKCYWEMGWGILAIYIFCMTSEVLVGVLILISVSKHSLETFPCLLHSSNKANCFIIVIFPFLFTKLLSQPSCQKNTCKLLSGAVKQISVSSGQQGDHHSRPYHSLPTLLHLLQRNDSKIRPWSRINQYHPWKWTTFKCGCRLWSEISN